MNSILVFCGSNAGKATIYAEITKKVGSILAQQGKRIIYGGGKVGLMGILADAALNSGGEVVGVIPEFLKRKEICHDTLTELHTVESMDERKKVMASLSDAVLVLPGGYGTLDELFEMLTLAQLSQSQQVCGILNIQGYYDHLIQLLDHMNQEQFLKAKHRELLLVDTEIIPLLEKMEKFEFHSDSKWFNQNKA